MKCAKTDIQKRAFDAATSDKAAQRETARSKAKKPSDIYAINKTGQSVTSDTSTVNNSISNNSGFVKGNSSCFIYKRAIKRYS